MVITRPDHDLVTRYLFHWSKIVIETAKKHHFPVIDLKRKQANRKEFIKAVKKVKPDFIFINGHGNEETVTGYNNQILVQVKDNESLFFGSIVFSRSCRSAAKLGKACIKKGTKAYIGYTDDFIFYIEEDRPNQPLKDKTAKLFLEPSNQIAVSLLSGHTAGKAHEEAKDDYKKNIQNLLNSQTSKKDEELIPYLLWDMEKQVCLGNKRSRLKK